MLWKIAVGVLLWDALHQRGWCWKRICIQCKGSRDLAALGVKKFRLHRKNKDRLYWAMRAGMVRRFRTHMDKFLRLHRNVERLLQEHVQLEFPLRFFPESEDE